MKHALATLEKRLRARWFYEVEMRALGRGARRPGVRLLHWRPRHGRNFGDELSRAIVGRLACEAGVDLDFTTPEPRRLLAVGSILHLARDGDVVWGSGVNGRDVADQPPFRRLDVRAVRGPLTREWLRRTRPESDVPEIYGDPGALTFHLFPALLRRRTLAHHPERIVIPNINDLRLRRLPTDLPLVSPLLPWPLVCEYVAHAKSIATSSLHGLVLAQALGKDVKLMRFSGTEPMFKYEDYALGVGRDVPRIFTDVSAAMRVDLSDEPTTIPAGLIEAFPADLWAGLDEAPRT